MYIKSRKINKRRESPTWGGFSRSCITSCIHDFIERPRPGDRQIAAPSCQLFANHLHLWLDGSNYPNSVSLSSVVIVCKVESGARQSFGSVQGGCG